MAKKIKLIALLPLLRFGLPQSEGQIVEVEKNQADELIESGYAELYKANSKEDVSTDVTETEEDISKKTSKETE